MMKQTAIVASLALALSLGACGSSGSSGSSSDGEQEQTEQVEEAPQEQAEQVLFDGDTMSVTLKDVREEAGIEGACYIYLDVENKTGAQVWFHPAIENATANGYSVMYTSGMPTYVDAGNRAIMGLILTYQQFDAQTFEDVHSIKFDLVQEDNGTHAEIARFAVDIER